MISRVNLDLVIQALVIAAALAMALRSALR